jgi:hypothetical protein
MNYENLTKEQLPQPFIDRIERFNEKFRNGSEDGHSFEEDDLFGYEMLCIRQALSFYDYFKQFSNEEMEKMMDEFLEDKKKTYKKERWMTDEWYEKERNRLDLYDIISRVKDKLPWYDDGHTGNSMSMSWMLFRTYRSTPDLVPYMHGSLAQLVGDSGYFDDRADVKEALEKHEQENPEQENEEQND